MNQPNPDEKSPAPQHPSGSKATPSDTSRQELDALRAMLGLSGGSRRPGTRPDDTDAADD